MVIESSKDYGTGNVIMVLDGETSPQEINDYLKQCYGEEICEGDKLEMRDGNTFRGLENPPTALLVKNPNAGSHRQEEGEA